MILSAVIFGCMPLMAKRIYADGVNTLSLVAMRSLLALPVLYIIIKAVKIDMRISAREFGSVAILCAMGSAITPVLLLYSYNFISSGMATTLHFVYPVFVMLGCLLIYREPIGFIKGLCAALCCAGMACFYSPGEVNAVGVILAVVSGVAYAAYMIMLDKSEARFMNPVKFCFYGAAACAVFMLLFCILTGSLTLPKTAGGWALCVLFAVLVMVGAVMLFQVGVALIGAQKAAILSTFEPITGTVIGIAAFNEPFGIRNLMGLILILSAVIILTACDGKTEKNIGGEKSAV